MDALLDKIDNISIPDTLIPQSDLEALNYMREQQLEAPYKDVTRAAEALNALKDPTPWLEGHIQEFKNTLERDVTSLREHFVEKVITYFNNIYSLGLHTGSAVYESGVSSSDTTPSNEDLLQVILDYVTEQLDGRSFQQVARDNFTSDFRKSVYRIKHNRRQVTLNRYVSTRDDYRGGITLGYSAYEELHLLGRAITVFVTNHASYNDDTILDHSQFRYDDHAPFGTALKTGFTDRHPTITLYMNGNARLSFADEATAAEFITFFDLNSKVN